MRAFLLLSLLTLCSARLLAEDLPPLPGSAYERVAFDEAFEGTEDAAPADPLTPIDQPAGSVPPPVPTEAEQLSRPEAPAEKKPAAKPKKKTPPAFPGPKTLPNTGPYKVLYFENDFSYKSDPDHKHVFGEELKDMKFEFLDQPFKLSTGGELRHRYMNELNRLRPGGPGRSDYDLWRWRHYVDMSAGERLRFYVEGIDASSFGEDLPEQQIDVNRWDLQNAFVDVNVYNDEDSSQTLRWGRQELLFGRQRLVSPLDWANTRRNFQGFRYLIKEPKWKADVFSVNPLNTATGYRSLAQFDHKFDQPNHDVYFSGAYATWTGTENTLIDLYWLWLEGTNNPTRPDGRRHTLGGRYSRLFPVKDECEEQPSRVWDFDVEAAYQTGKDGGDDVVAGFGTIVLGHAWKKAWMTPRLSGLVYAGSGDRRTADGDNNTFNVLFPLGHAYWAISDNLAGQNLIDWAVQADVKPTEKTTLTCAYHKFLLAHGSDVVYNVAGVPFGTRNNGTDLGDALDVYGSFALNPNLDLQMGYSQFWYGKFIDRTVPRGDANQLYIQSSLRY